MKNAILVIGMLLLFLGCANAQASHPNFTGTWKLNPHLSKFGPYTDRSVDSYKLTLAEPKLEILHVVNGKQQSTSLVLDGKERTFDSRENITAKAYWDGDTIVAEKRQVVANSNSVWTTRYSVSADGKQLTISQHVSKSSMAPAFDEVLVYERQ